MTRTKPVFIGVLDGRRIFHPSRQKEGKPYIRQYSDGTFRCCIQYGSTYHHGYGITAQEAFDYCCQHIDWFAVRLDQLLNHDTQLFSPKKWWQFWR